MNRQIIFRGKRTGSGDWVEGSLLVYADGDCFICCQDVYPDVMNKYEVDPATVGQFTGLMDYESEEHIYEHDILESQTGDNHKWIVAYDDGGFYIQKIGAEHSKKRKCQNDIDDLCIDNIVWYMLKKVGNIHDTPELLQG